MSRDFCFPADCHRSFYGVRLGASLKIPYGGDMASTKVLKLEEHAEAKEPR